MLGVRENKEKHKKESFRRKDYELLEEFKIKDKVVKIVTDNEAKRHSAYKDNERVCCVALNFHSSRSHGCDEVQVVKDTVLKTGRLQRKWPAGGSEEEKGEDAA